MQVMNLLVQLKMGKQLDLVEKVIFLAPAFVTPAGVWLWYAPCFILDWMRIAIAKTFNALAFHPNTDKALINSENEKSSKNPLYILKALLRQIKACPTKDELQMLDLPCLIIYGKSDKLTPPEQGHQLCASLKNATYKLLDNSSHMLMLEQPQELNTLIETFLQHQLIDQDF